MCSSTKIKNSVFPIHHDEITAGASMDGLMLTHYVYKSSLWYKMVDMKAIQFGKLLVLIKAEYDRDNHKQCWKALK